jgi:RNA polymerase sigma-54 factor
LKATLRQGLSQQLRLTPQLQQAIRLLTLSRLELEAELSAAIERNPLLERPEEAVPEPEPAPGPELKAERMRESGNGSEERPQREREDEGGGDYGEFEQGSGMSWGSGSHDGEDGNDAWETRAAAAPSLHEHLMSQLDLLHLRPRERAIADTLIALMDEDGFLREPPEALLAQMPPELNADPDIIEALRHRVQALDPVGILSRDLGDCLAAQLRAMDPEVPGRALATALVTQHLKELPRCDRTKLAARLGTDCDALRTAFALLERLDPRPAAAFTDAPVEYVVPDVIARRERGVWRVSLNPAGQPSLRLNRHYERLARARGAAQSYLREHLREARWLLNSLQSRADTLLRVSECIVREQTAFLEFGPEAMRPLTLREVADLVNLAESTVSRVTTRKYIATPRGTFELKHFFSSALQNREGGATSSHAIRALIRKMIAEENKPTPLSDQSLAELLGEKGINVARRTVAKYREAMNIPPSSERARPA